MKEKASTALWGFRSLGLQMHGVKRWNLNPQVQVRALEKTRKTWIFQALGNYVRVRSHTQKRQKYLFYSPYTVESLDTQTRVEVLLFLQFQPRALSWLWTRAPKILIRKNGVFYFFSSPVCFVHCYTIAVAFLQSLFLLRYWLWFCAKTTNLCTNSFISAILVFIRHVLNKHGWWDVVC